MAEDQIALHPQMARRPGRGHAAIHMQQFAIAPVAVQVAGQDAAIVAGARAFLRLQHHGAGAVAEQHAGAPVGPVHDAREGLGPDHQDAAGQPRAQHRIGIGQRKDEARADRLHVIGKAARDPQALLNHRGDRRKGEIGCRGRQHDPVDIIRAQPGAIQRDAGGARRQVAGHLALGGEMAPFDPGAGADPFVGRVELVLEPGILDDTLGQVMPGAGDDGTNGQCAAPESPVAAGLACAMRAASRS